MLESEVVRDRIPAFSGSLDLTRGGESVRTIEHGPEQSRQAPNSMGSKGTIRMDPYESYDSKDPYGHLMQKVSWLIAPMGELMNAHLKSLEEYPPVQGGKSFDMSNVVDEFIKKARQ